MISLDVLLSVSFLSMVAVVASAILAIIPLVAAGSALGLFRLGVQSFSDSFRRLPEREKSWGTVYDSGTLRPIPFAGIRLFGMDKRVLEKRVADKGGRFGFLTTPASLSAPSVDVQLDAQASGYSFPSGRQEGAAGLLYGNIYRGGRLTIGEDALVNVDIPMDPVHPPKKALIKRSPSIAAGVATAAMADAGLWIGLAAVPLAFILNPGPFTLGVLFLYSGTASLRLFGIGEHPYGAIADKQGRAVPFALVTLHDDAGDRVAYVVSDEKGRYFMAVEKGSYVMTVHTPANVKPSRQIECAITARKGWITRKIIL